MRFAIIDDEQPFLEQITKTIKSLINEPVSIDCYIKALDFYAKTQETEYDAYFIDIDMPIVNGFELSQKLLEQNSDIPIIYVTGRDELVIQAFRYKALGFVRKQNMESELRYALSTLFKEFENNYGFINVTEVKYTGGREHRIPVKTIKYIQTDGHNTIIQLSNSKTVTVRKPLSFYSKNELFKNFILVDSGTLVNLKLITYIDNKVVFKDGKSEYLGSSVKLHSDIVPKRKTFKVRV